VLCEISLSYTSIALNYTEVLERSCGAFALILWCISVQASYSTCICRIPAKLVSLLRVKVATQLYINCIES
jgi:hypothetical protein